MEKELFERIKHKIYSWKHYTTSGNVDLEIPSSSLNISGFKIAVYSCITGGYDSVIEPLHTEPGTDYFMFTDGEVLGGSQWKKIDITKFKEYRELSPAQLNRKIKILPFRYLPDYDYTIYIDGNIEIIAPLSPLIEEMGNHAFGVHYHRTRDCIYDELVQILYLQKADPVTVKQQVSAYKKEGFPRHFGLYENSLLIRKHGDEEVRQLMEAWWEEFLRYPARDQLSLPYVIWKTGYDRRKIHIVGRNILKNPRVKRTQLHTIML